MATEMGRDRKTEAPGHSSYRTIKIPLCSKAARAEYWTKLCIPSQVMGTSPYMYNISDVYYYITIKALRE